MHIDPEILDVGLVLKGGPHVRSITVGNTGSAPLTIEGLETSRACSVEGAPDHPIKAGGQAEIRVALDGAELKGLVQEFITVRTDDPVAPARTIPIIGYAVETASAAPAVDAVIIQPEGEPVKVPGTGRVFYRSYRVTNLLPVTVGIVSAGGTLGPRQSGGSELAPGATVSLDVPLQAADGRETVPLTILLPATFPVLPSAAVTMLPRSAK